MKTRYTVPILLALLTGTLEATAATAAPVPAQRLTYEEKIEVANAINLLINEDVLTIYPNQCLKFSITSPETTQRLSYKEQLEVTDAYNLLVGEHVLKATPDQCLKFDGGIISELRKMGLLEYGDSKVLTVCFSSRGTK